MQTSISMPSILKAVAALKVWLTKENETASSFMGESVTNQQIIYVACASFGLLMAPFIFGSMPFIGVVGLLLMAFGSFNLAE